MAKLKALMETKDEYITHFGDLLSDAFLIELQTVYNSVKDSSNANILKSFQDGLAAIGTWNSYQIDQMYERIQTHSKCGYFQDLIKSTFVVYVKIHMLSHGIKDNNSLRIRIPANANFIHRCLVTCASSIWKRPYLFYHNVRSLEKRTNMNEVDTIIRK